MSNQPSLVIDTNIVLDILLFADYKVSGLIEQLRQDKLMWIATDSMRQELIRVLDYRLIKQQLGKRNLTVQHIMQDYDALAYIQEQADKAIYLCKDPDDQKFVDLAVKNQSFLLSKDKAVLKMRSKLLGLNVKVVSNWQEIGR